MLGRDKNSGPTKIEENEELFTPESLAIRKKLRAIQRAAFQFFFTLNGEANFFESLKPN